MGFRSALFPLGLGAPGQAGFRNPLPVPPLSGGGITQAGFRGPLPVIPLGGSGVTQAGYRGPLPVIQIGATDILQAGFVGPIPFVNMGATDTGPRRRQLQGDPRRMGGTGYGPIPEDERHIYDDRIDIDEDWLLVAMAFMEMNE